MGDRRCFTAHFVICLAIAAATFFAWDAGMFQLVYTNDVARWFGGTIGVLFLISTVHLGWQAWLVGSPFRFVRNEADASFGHLAVWLFPSIGMLGTVVGLSLVFKNIGDASALAGGATAFYSTGCGLVAMILTMIMTYALERGIARAGR